MSSSFTPYYSVVEIKIHVVKWVIILYILFDIFSWILNISSFFFYFFFLLDCSSFVRRSCNTFWFAVIYCYTVRNIKICSQTVIAHFLTFISGILYFHFFFFSEFKIVSLISLRCKVTDIILCIWKGNCMYTQVYVKLLFLYYLFWVS